jgi:hypothetical protein
VLRGPGVPKDEEPFVVLRGIELEVGNDDVSQLVDHPPRNDESPHILASLTEIITLNKNLDINDRVELNKISIPHTGILSIANGTSSGNRAFFGRSTSASVSRPSK